MKPIEQSEKMEEKYDEDCAKYDLQKIIEADLIKKDPKKMKVISKLAAKTKKSYDSIAEMENDWQEDSNKKAMEE